MSNIILFNYNSKQAISEGISNYAEKRLSEIIERYNKNKITENEFESLMRQEYESDPYNYSIAANRIAQAQQDKIKELYEMEKVKRTEQIKRIFEGMNAEVIKAIYAASQVYHLPLRSCIYFIKNDCTGLIKIGIAENIKNRFNQIKTAFSHVGMPSELKLVGIVLTYPKYLNALEKHFHNQYKSKRIIGEWFELSEEEVLEELIPNTEYSDIVNDVFINYMDYEYFYFDDVEKEYNITIDELGYKNLLEISDPLFIAFSKPNKLLEIVKSVETNKVGFYDIVLDSNLQVHHVGIRYMHSDEWYSFQDIKAKAFNRQYWESVIKTINK